MFSHELSYLVYKEKNRELEREAARQQLIRIAMLQRSHNRQSFRKMAGRIGSQMIEWGLKLQHYKESHPQTLTQQG